MPDKQTVLVLGATGGGAGTDVVNGLLDDGSFDVRVFVRTTSANSPATQFLRNRGLPIITGDLRAPVASLIPHLAGIDILISCLGANAQLAQLNWVDAAAQAGIKRFVPCGFTTISPRGGVMMLRDEKEEVHDRIFLRKVPFTIVDVGYWHQISYPSVPSGRMDYVQVAPVKEIYGDGRIKTLLTDKRDQGRWMARIVKDERTVNKRVVVWSDELSQEEMWEVTERVAEEKLPRNYVSAEEVQARLDGVTAAFKQDESNWQTRAGVWAMQYINSKFVRGDNTLENAKYLGYLDARELYPDFKPRTFEGCVREALEGRAEKLYGGKGFEDIIGGENAKRE